MSVFDQTDSESILSPEMPDMTHMSHNTLPLLHEVRHALRRLVRTGESTIIDLRAIHLDRVMRSVCLTCWVRVR